MKLKAIDHFVITTTDLQKCLDFYVVHALIEK